MKDYSTILMISIFLISTYVHATADIIGSSDHKLISRYPNTEIVSFRTSEYENSFVVTAPALREGKTVKHNLMEIEGKTTSITYRLTSTQSSVELIAKNYLNSLKKSGFNTLFTCKNDSECGYKFAPTYYWNFNTRRQGQHKFLDAINLHGARSTYVYYSGSLRHSSAVMYVELLISGDTAGNRRPIIVLDIYEAAKEKTDKISINIEHLNTDMENNGSAVLDGLFFSTNSANIQPESKYSLKVIAEYLSAHPEKSFYVVGHTDNEGSFSHNIELSKLRAASVIKQLHLDFQIEPQRLHAIGVGPTSPRSSNQSSEGKKRNRRVELVLQ